MPRKKSSDETSGSRQCRSEKTFAGWRSVKVWLGLWKHHRQEVFVDFTSQTLACFTNQSKPFAKRVIWACLRYFESWHSRSQLARKRSNHHPPENHVPQLHSTNETSQMHWKLWAKLNFLKNERVLDDRIMPIIPAPNSWLQTRLKFISKPKAKFTQLWLSHVQRLQDFPQLSQTTCVHISSYFLVVLDPKKKTDPIGHPCCVYQGCTQLERTRAEPRLCIWRSKMDRYSLWYDVQACQWSTTLWNGCRKLFSRLPQTWPRRQLANARSTGNAKPLILSGIPQNPTFASFWIKDQKRSKTIKDFHTGSGSISGRKAIG